MNMLFELAARSLLGFGLVLVLLQAAARELGYAYGQWRARHKEAKDEGVGLVVSSILGLLVFVLALTLSASSTRFAERRAGALAEANAIGTAWLQASAIDNSRATEIARLLQDYTTERIVFVTADLGTPELAQSSDRTSSLQTEIWGHLTALVREVPGPVSTSLMNALNTTFDMTSAMRYAMGFGMPPQLLWLLLSLSLIGMGLLGYQFGLQGKHHRVLTLLMSVLWTAVMVEILDIGTARVGSLRVDVQPYVWTLEGMGAGALAAPGG